MNFYQFLGNQLSRFFPSDAVVRKRYNAFMALLEQDRNAHVAMAELEQLYYDQTPVDFKTLQEKYNNLSQAVLRIITALDSVSLKSQADLHRFYHMIDGFGRHLFYEETPELSPPFVLPLTDEQAQDRDLTGGKTAALAATGKLDGIAIPKGFAVTTRAFNRFMEVNELRRPIDELLANISSASPEALGHASAAIIELVQRAAIPPEIESAILNMTDRIWAAPDSATGLAVRSSAVGEDETLSFAGQYRSLLNVRRENILEAWRKVIESKYSPRALNYRIQCGFIDAQTPMGVLVLEMIDPEISGVMYTRPPDQPEKGDINIHAVYGLGEVLVDGRAVPEVTHVQRSDPPRIRNREKGRQSRQLVPSSGGGTRIEITPDRSGQILADRHAIPLAQAGKALETLFSGPQDVEWCLDRSGNLVLLQSRPLQTHGIEATQVRECTFEDVEEHCLVSGGQTACPGIAAGPAVRVNTRGEIEDFPSGGVLIAPHALADFARILSRAAAVVTQEGSVAGHFASVAREFGVPCITGMAQALEKIPANQVVTVNAIERTVFRGRVKALVENPCAKPRPLSQSPFMRRFSFLMRFVSPLKLVDPDAPNFTPTGCRSLHDIIRYSHETAVNSMFDIGSNRWFSTRGIKKLEAGIPVKVNVLDVGGGIGAGAEDEKTIAPDQINSLPMTAVLKGLLHPGIQWGSFSHFNWEEHDRIVMNGGIISPDNAMFASHAILGRDYLNLNLKFGYHFVIVDALCGGSLPENQIRFRFSGGGAKMEQRMLRTRFLEHILSWLGFTVDIKHDLIEAVFVSKEMPRAMDRLDYTGRLLGATRLMDMYLNTEADLHRCVRDFKNGIYHYGDDLE
jgi:pyruvate,water dikinase